MKFFRKIKCRHSSAKKKRMSQHSLAIQFARKKLWNCYACLHFSFVYFGLAQQIKPGAKWKVKQTKWTEKKRNVDNFGKYSFQFAWDICVMWHFHSTVAVFTHERFQVSSRLKNGCVETTNPIRTWLSFKYHIYVGIYGKCTHTINRNFFFQASVWPLHPFSIYGWQHIPKCIQMKMEFAPFCAS